MTIYCANQLSGQGVPLKKARFLSSLKERRTAVGLSQADLARKIGVSRQALIYIEAGKQIPSTQLALQLAHTLRCTVEDLFRLAGGPLISSRLAVPEETSVERVIVGRIGDELIAHPQYDDTQAADGWLLDSTNNAGLENGIVELFSSRASIDSNVLVAGCAPLLGVLCDRLGRQYADTRATWIPADSSQALSLLKKRLVHIAGIHLANNADPKAHISLAKHAFPNETATLVNLARWKQGLLVAAGNPLGIKTATDLLRPGLRYAGRTKGSGAQKLLSRLLAKETQATDIKNSIPLASNHAEVARLVSTGVADAGIAIESAALAEELSFIPLSQERFDLVLSESQLKSPAVSRFLSLIDQSSFRSEAGKLPGYDLSLSGHLTTLDASRPD